MIVFDQKRDQERVVNAIKNPETATYPPSFDLYIDKINVAMDVEKFSLETGQNGALILDATLAGRLPSEAVQSPCLFQGYIDGLAVPLFAGRVGSAKISISSTELLCHSGATYLDDSKLGSGVLLGKELLLYAGRASQLIRQVLKPTNIYGGHDYQIDQLNRKLSFSASFQGFTPDQSVRDVLSRIAQEAKCVYRDAPFGRLGRFEAFLDPRLGTAKQVDYEYDINTEATAFTHEAESEKMYFDVVVEQVPQLTANPPLEGFRARVPVPYKRLPFLPPYSLTDWRQVTDTDDIFSEKDARRYARQIARDYAELPETTNMTVSFNPLLQLYDVLHMTETVFVPGGTYAYDWRLVIDTLKSESEKMTTDITGRGTIHGTPAFTKDAPILVSSRSSRVVPTPKPYAYFDQYGFLELNVPACVNSAGVAWAYFDGSGELIVDTALSENRAYFDMSGHLMLEVPPSSIPVRYAYFDPDGTLQLDLDKTFNSEGVAWAWVDAGQLMVDVDLAEGRVFFDTNNELMLEVP